MERDPELAVHTDNVSNVKGGYVENFFDFHIFEKSSWWRDLRVKEWNMEYGKSP